MAHLSTAAASAKITSKHDQENHGSRMTKKNRHKTSSSLAGCTDSPTKDGAKCPFHWSSSLASSSAEYDEAKLKEALEPSIIIQEYGQFPMKSSLIPLLSQKSLKYPTEEENSLASLMLQRNSQSLPWKWSRIRKGIRRRKLIGLRRRRSTDGANQRSTSTRKNLQDHALFEEDARGRIDGVSRENTSAFSLNSACFTSHDCQQKYPNKITCGEVPCQLTSSLSNKYQPKVFQEIAGQEMIVKTLTNAVQKKKIVSLYLFHGPSGTGKTSTARIFVMALNCESIACVKPCWSCRGCSRSLYTMDLCSGSRTLGFEKIRTLLQNTTFTQIVFGFKVFIIEECHSLMEDAWEEILSIVEKGYGSAVVFIVITEDANMVPKAVSSRCQKFCFSKLNDVYVTMKLARIVAHENIRIEKDALKLIVSKADGSMREAENILDQLALLGSRITSSMVQQIVGLVPHSKLLDLLATVISADTIKIVRSTRELIASGVQPQSLLSQLASLITDILSDPSAIGTFGSSKEMRLSVNGSELTSNQYESLSRALKILVETEKQLSSSSDHTTWVITALMQIASELTSNSITNGIVLPVISLDDKFNVGSRQKSIQMSNKRLSDHNKSRKCQQGIERIPEQLDTTTNDPCATTTQGTCKSKRSTKSGIVDVEPERKVSDMDEIWLNILAKMQSTYVKEFLSKQANLASLTISSANAIVHLMFKRSEDKLAAQTSEETIAKALKNALGCPVIVNMSLEPMQLEIIEQTNTSMNKSKETDSGHSRQQQQQQQQGLAQCSSSARVAMRRSKSQKSCGVSENLKFMKLKENTQISQRRNKFTCEAQERITAQSQEILPFSGPLTQVDKGNASVEPENNTSSSQMNSIRKTSKPKHRCVSVSSIQQGDASVEPYSQDLLFENANTNRERGGIRNSKGNKEFSKDNQNLHFQSSVTPKGLRRSWSCSNIFCRGEGKVKNHVV